MRARSPRRTQPGQDTEAEDESLPRSGPPDGRAPSALLRRIAGALQIPPAALYGPPDAVAPAWDGASAVGLDRDCLALLHAYTRIRDRGERQRILALAQEAAGRP